MQNAEGKTPQSASLTAPLSGRAAAELWDLRSAILSDLVGADIKSDTADKRHPFILPQSKSQSDFASSLREGALYLPR